MHSEMRVSSLVDVHENIAGAVCKRSYTTRRERNRSMSEIALHRPEHVVDDLPQIIRTFGTLTCCFLALLHEHPMKSPTMVPSPLPDIIDNLFSSHLVDIHASFCTLLAKTKANLSNIARSFVTSTAFLHA